MGILTTVTAVLFIITCILLILVVLLQKGRGGGLGAALGGAGSAAFGTKVGDFMTWVTIVLTSMFLLLAVVVTLLFRPPETQAAEPSFVPNPSLAITEDTYVTIKPGPDGEDDKIYYTTDGSEPDRDSEPFGNAFSISPGTLVRAIAYPQRGLKSIIVDARYNAPQPYPPSLNPLPNPQDPITVSTKVTITAGKETDKVYFTTDGSEPTEKSRLYAEPITIEPKMTLKVRAFAPNAEPSDIVDVTYGLQGMVTPPITPPPTTQPASIPTTAPTTVPAVGVGQ